MAVRHESIITGEVYHVFNRGVEKRDLFIDDVDRQHFLDVLSFYLDEVQATRFSFLTTKQRQRMLQKMPTHPRVEILAYCLMGNHFHLIIRQLGDEGIRRFLHRALNSYARYFNTRYERVGALFQGRFRAVRVTSDAQLLHLIRYLHLNPYVSHLVETLDSYTWSSHPLYAAQRETRLVRITQGMSFFDNDPERYRKFLEDYQEYARSLHLLRDIAEQSR
ncbi:transposase [Candidatus Berkelbacteria bacterium]|nr:transposase [Candidatus Berkelbacteria bacterium]